MSTQTNKEEIREKLAEIEHQRWADWQKYMHTHVYDSSESINPHLKVIPTELYNRWERQIMTPYSELSEAEKDSDRKQVERYWPLIQELLDSQQADLKAKVMAMIEEQKRPYDEDAESDHSGAYRYFENREICDQLLSNLKDLI